MCMMYNFDLRNHRRRFSLTSLANRILNYVSVSQDLAGGADEPGEACWVKTTNGELPEGAVVGGSDLDCDLYIARANHEGELLPGKYVPSHGVCYISWDGAEHAKDEFEILCGCKAIWHQVNEEDAIPENALPGGRTADGETLFVGRVPHENTVTLGKVRLATISSKSVNIY